MVTNIVDLLKHRRAELPPGPPAPDDLREAVDRVRGYVLRLMAWSEEQHGVAAVACGDLCCFADCIERVADQLGRG